MDVGLNPFYRTWGMADILKSRGFDKTPFYMSMILFNEIIEMLNGAMFRMDIKIVMFQFFERTK